MFMELQINYFKAREIAALLGYKYPANAIQDNVELEDKIICSDLIKTKVDWKTTLSKIHPQTIFITESGLYSLILSSKLSQAKEFKRWVTSEVLPSIRKSGNYIPKEVQQKLTFNLQTEADLQKAIVNYLRNKYPG